MGHSDRILIVSPNRDAYSETFIRAHIDRLPGVVGVLTDGALPQRDHDGTLLISTSLGARVQRKLSRTSLEQAQAKAVLNRIRQLRADVVLAEYGTTGEALIDICTEAGVPLVVHFHGIDAFHTDLAAQHANYQRILGKAAAIVVVSNEMEQRLLALGAPRERLHHNRYGIDVQRFSPTEPASAGKQFVSVGRFVDKKAPHLLVTAFHRAWQQDQDLHLTMIGDGPLHGSTRQLAHALGLEDAVTFTGALAHDRIAEHMAQARGFVQHSIASVKNDREGTPLSVLEAMARALPVISTRHGGIPDAVGHGVSGLLCNEGDIIAMGEHLLELARDPAKARTMGIEGRRTIEARYTMEQSIAGLGRIIAQAVAKR
ncbi:MAG TPA: glycosyltransferase [Flavobacteriales bacterium]